MHHLNVLILTTLTILVNGNSNAIEPQNEVLFLISSQNTEYHRSLSLKLKEEIFLQSNSIPNDTIVRVEILNEILKRAGVWTILFAIPHLIISDKVKWIVFCEETTRVNLPGLLKELTKENHELPMYLGYPLYDREATIIHHFAFPENSTWFPYPMLRSGVIFSRPLLTRVASLLRQQKPQRPHNIPDFSIDPAHELALFIMTNIRRNPNDSQRHIDAKSNDSVNVWGKENRKGNLKANKVGGHGSARVLKTQREKVILKRAAFICPGDATVATKSIPKHCAMYSEPMQTGSCHAVSEHNIYFAIKTCQKYHKERIPIIEATWASQAIHKTYFSDIADEDIPTVSTGIPNVESGHCMKTFAILKLAIKDIQQRNQYLQNDTIRWLHLSDDDTLLSVARLNEMVRCFNHSHYVYMGERYGYQLNSPNGFNYITSGGGILFSLPTVELLLRSCTCPSSTSPDDMIIGSCLQSLNILAIHSSRFHQARPMDYPIEILAFEPPISFHKFWQMDPIVIYNKWLKVSDRPLKRESIRPSDQIDHFERIEIMERSTCMSNVTITFNQCPYLSTDKYINLY